MRAVHRILPNLLRDVPRFFTPRLLLKRSAVQRIAVQSDLMHVIAEPYTLVARGYEKPLVVTAHGTYLPQTATKGRFAPLYQYMYRRAQVICVSFYTEGRVKRAVSGVHTTVIPNGVDLRRFMGEAHPVEKRGPTILVVGQVKARKGFHILAKAMAAVRREIPEAQAVFIGDDRADPNYVNQIKEDLAAQNLSDAVQWVGKVDDATLRGWYAAADIFALPALNVGDRFEGFGLVYLEASAARLPVIGTRDNGAEDAIRDGETGLLVPQNDPEALAQVAVKLLRDADLRQRMGQAGYTFAAQHTWERTARETIALYQRLIGR